VAPKLEPPARLPLTSATPVPALKSEAKKADVKEPAAPSKKRELNEKLTALRSQVRASLGLYFPQPFNTTQHTAGDILCVCLPFGCDTEVYHEQQKLNGITCLCWNYPCSGYSLLTQAEGHLAARVGYGLELYPSQFIATLALARVPTDYPARVGKTVRSVADLVAYEKLSCREGGDLSLKLLGLSYYAEPGETWKNDAGETWSVARLIEKVLDEPMAADSCGGTHRLLALSCAAAKQAKLSPPLTGAFARAQKYADDFQTYAFRLQNSDGSWHPAFFAAMGTSSDNSGNLRSTGHIAQWLALSLSDARLEEARMTRTIAYLTELLGYQQARWEATGLSSRDLDSLTHALHALAVYDLRVFRPCDPPPESSDTAAASEKPQP
jgi:hypothetical protein